MILMVIKMVKNNDLFLNITNSEIRELLKKYLYPHEILSHIHDYILELGNKLDNDSYDKISDNIWIHKSVKMGMNVEIIGPAIIMEGVILRHNAYIRENVIIGPNSIVGNSCEIKNSVLIGDCEVPHFNYVGDSILGNKVHLGAGVILSNLRLDKKNILINNLDTNLRKIGAFIGDNAQIGCNSVLCPGTIVYPDTIIFPQTVAKGIIKDNKKEVRVEKL